MKSNESAEMRCKTIDLIPFRINKTGQNHNKVEDVGNRFHFQESDVVRGGVGHQAIFSRLAGTVTCSK